MNAEIIAIVGAVLFGAGHIFIKKGLAHSNPFTGTLISIFSNVIFLWSLVLIYVPLNLFKSKYIFIFIIASIFAPTSGRFFTSLSISKLGVSRSTPINSSSSIYSSILAVIFLGEKITPAILVGTLFIVGGVILLSQREKEEKTQWRKVDLIFPFMAALSFAISSNIRKFGLLQLHNPLVGATVTSTSALVIMLIIMYAFRSRNALELNKPSFVNYFIAGLCYGGGFLMNFIALSKGNVVVVEPLVRSNPLFAILLSYLFLKGTDVVTYKIVLGAVMVFLGVLSLTL